MSHLALPVALALVVAGAAGLGSWRSSWGQGSSGLSSPGDSSPGGSAGLRGLPLREVGPVVAAGLVGALLLWVATGWPAAAVWGGVGGGAVVVLRRRDVARRQATQLLDAEAAWVALVRGQVSGSASLAEAILVASRRAPVGAESLFGALAEAVSHFGVARGVAIWRRSAPASMAEVALALELAGRAPGTRVADVLEQAAGRLRAEAAAARTIERERRQVRLEARIVVGLLVGWVVLAAHDGSFFGHLYDGLVGQLLLFGVLGLLALVVTWLTRLDQVAVR